jgi:hypothetical protein
VVIVLAIGPMVPGSNPAKDSGLLRATKIHSATSFGGEVKPSAPCKILLHAKETLRNDIY